jgi:hypothetical protein
MDSLTSVVLSLSKLSAMGLMAAFYSHDPLRGAVGSATPSGSATGTATGRPLHRRPCPEIYWPATRKEGGEDFLGDMSEMGNVEARTRITGFALVVGGRVEAVVLAQ